MGYYKQIVRSNVFINDQKVRTSKERKTYTLFTCVSNRSKEIWQGIAFSDGTYRAGYDCWRSLNKMDFCDYPFKNYKNRAELEQDVTSIQSYRRKAYYLSDEKEAAIC